MIQRFIILFPTENTFEDPTSTQCLEYIIQYLIRLGDEESMSERHELEHSDSVVECLTRDQWAAGLSLTGVTVLCP